MLLEHFVAVVVATAWLVVCFDSFDSLTDGSLLLNETHAVGIDFGWVRWVVRGF
jgi:hypothetical protein